MIFFDVVLLNLYFYVLRFELFIFFFKCYIVMFELFVCFLILELLYCYDLKMLCNLRALYIYILLVLI